MSKFELLTKHIHGLLNEKKGKAAEIESLHRDIYSFCEAHPEYDHTNYHESFRANGIEWDFNSMSDADVSDMDAKTLIALLIGACRAERFSDGAFMEFIENGSVERWLKRLKELDEINMETESTIIIRQIGISKLTTDCIVNAANSGLREGSGVCEDIFRDAGSYELQKACDEYGGCNVGRAVITPGFNLKAKYIIHAVGPHWNGGTNGEREQLYSCYQESMKLAIKNGCHSIAFPVISSGVFGYPKKEAWKVALQSVRDFQHEHNEYRLDVIFAVRSDESYELGNEILPSLL